MWHSDRNARSGCCAARKEELGHVVMKQSLAHSNRLPLGEILLCHLLLQRPDYILPRHHAVAVTQLDVTVVPAESKDLVGRHGLQIFMQGAYRGGRGDDM